MFLVLGIVFIGWIQPMVIVIGIIMITLYYSYGIIEFVGGYWYRYALVLVMISGVLVVFTYMVRIIPNEGFEVLGLVNLSVFFVLLIEKVELRMLDDIGLMTLKLWDLWVSGVNIYMVMFLFFVIVIVVWLGGVTVGSLRVLGCAWWKGLTW